MELIRKSIVFAVAAIVSSVSSNLFAICILGVGECTYADCLDKRMSGCDTQYCIRAAYDVCKAKFPGSSDDPVLVEGKDYDFIQTIKGDEVTYSLENKSSEHIGYVALKVYKPCNGRTQIDESDRGRFGNEIAGKIIPPGGVQDIVTIGTTPGYSTEALRIGQWCMLSEVRSIR